MWSERKRACEEPRRHDERFSPCPWTELLSAARFLRYRGRREPLPMRFGAFHTQNVSANARLSRRRETGYGCERSEESEETDDCM